jgi:SNF2 family DNA or RNA helicase
MQFQPHDYQIIAMDWIRERPYAGLFLDMGMGKTAVALTVANELLYDSFDVRKVLVIAPKKVAEDTWSRETAKWDHLRHLRISKVLGSREQRLVELAREADIYVINRENVVWLVETLGAEWNFDMVIVDELSSFKNHRAKRFRALRKVRPLIKRVVGLTGTPVPNGYMDLWAEVYLLDRGERLGRTITQYRNQYFYSVMLPGFQIYKLRAGAEEQINAAVADICLSMKAKDYLKLREPLRIDVPVVLSNREMGRYKTMERDAVLAVMDHEIVGINAAAVTTKLLQMANGAVYDDRGQVAHIHDQKLERLAELVEGANGRPVLVFYSFKHDRDRIKQHLKIEVRELQTPQDIEDWNAGKIPILLAHPASCGHGLNLQGGGNIIIWFGLPWSLELYQQANARLHRQGQAEGVVIYHLIAEGTVDEEVLRALQGKGRTQEEFLEAIKARIREEVA